MAGCVTSVALRTAGWAARCFIMPPGLETLASSDCSSRPELTSTDGATRRGDQTEASTGAGRRRCITLASTIAWTSCATSSTSLVWTLTRLGSRDTRRSISLPSSTVRDRHWFESTRALSSCVSVARPHPTPAPLARARPHTPVHARTRLLTRSHSDRLPLQIPSSSSTSLQKGARTDMLTKDEKTARDLAGAKQERSRADGGHAAGV